MSSKIRKGTSADIARAAYMLLVWDQELPEWLRLLHGDANLAYRSAVEMSGPGFETWLAEEDGVVVGALAIQKLTSLFGYHQYGNVSVFYVLPSHRGHRLIGLKLLRKALEAKREHGWDWLELSPWADDVNTKRVLERLGFGEAYHVYMAR